MTKAGAIAAIGVTAARRASVASRRPVRIISIPLTCAVLEPLLPSARDQRAALLIIAVNRHAFPDAVLVIGIAAGERVGGGAIRGIDDENAADRCFAVIGDQRAGRYDIDGVVPGFMEMEGGGAVMLGPRRKNVLLVECMDDKKMPGSSAEPHSKPSTACG